MITEPTQIPLPRRVHEFAFTKRHEVEVSDFLYIVILHTLAKCIFVDDLANILEDEISRLQIGIRSKSKSFFLCLDDGHVGILFSREALILAFPAAPAVADALHFRRAVNAIRIFATRKIFPRDGI